MAPMRALKSEFSSIIFSLLQRLILILKDPQRSSCSTLSFQGVGSLLTHLQKSNPFSSFFLKDFTDTPWKNAFFLGCKFSRFLPLSLPVELCIFKWSVVFIPNLNMLIVTVTEFLHFLVCYIFLWNMSVKQSRAVSTKIGLNILDRLYKNELLLIML